MVPPAGVPPSASATRAASVRLRLRLPVPAAETMPRSIPFSAAVTRSAFRSLGQQDPPNPGPGFRDFGPMRLSRPMRRATI
jgi:hypothetical protein